MLKVEIVVKVEKLNILEINDLVNSGARLVAVKSLKPGEIGKPSEVTLVFDRKEWND